jgi:hypothetical protein
MFIHIYTKKPWGESCVFGEIIEYSYFWTLPKGAETLSFLTNYLLQFRK